MHANTQKVTKLNIVRKYKTTLLYNFVNVLFFTILNKNCITNKLTINVIVQGFIFLRVIRKSSCTRSMLILGSLKKTLLKPEKINKH